MAFLEGGLAAAERPAIESHLEACAPCAELVTWAAADQAHRSRSAGREGRPFVGQLAPGSRVERYQILGAVGRGGMGEVYAAYHPDLDRRIALKVVGESTANAPERRARLLREARAIARLSHPNVVSVYDAGTVGDRVYIAMEFVEGETVDEWLRSKQRGWREILDVFVAAGRGLAAAHTAGVVHRDFKPQNVMIGRDGSVRVMDFGLARLAEEPTETAEAGSATDASPLPATVTKTGALVGTLAYMAPEQFRGESVDARADQFSFCVALHEAVFGIRPALAHSAGAGDRATKDSKLALSSIASAAPAWLRGTIARGISPDREQRFPSMDALLTAMSRGRTRLRRRVSVLSVGIATLLLAFGGWRLALARHVSCAVPRDRLAGAWLPDDASDPRRQAIHRAFAASGRPAAETSWQRVSKILDEYVRDWSAMYGETCQATHIRGEQSAEVLDLRMSCLADNLDQVRALTSVLASADSASLGQAVAAASDLTPIARCADVALLRSAVPLPRDERTLTAVRELRRDLREAQALRDVANFRGAWSRAVALRPRVEATGYKPLLAELLELIGCAGYDSPSREKTLYEALFTAEAARDDETAAKAATDLILLHGYPAKPHEAEMWLGLSESIIDRLGPGHERVRGWARNNFAVVLHYSGDFVRAERFAKEAIALKEQVLGRSHPDLAITLANLSDVLDEVGRPAEAFDAANRAIDILGKYGDPDSDLFGKSELTKGRALLALGNAIDGEASFRNGLRIYSGLYGSDTPMVSAALQGIGDAHLAQGAPAKAVPVLEEALRSREARESFPYLVAETRFSLARALWESGDDRHRSVDLAQQALKTFSDHVFQRRERAVVNWLADHKRTVPGPSPKGR